MTRAFTLLLGFILLLGSSCTQKLICPAYQSSFIYDKEALRKKFSYFKEDSTPKILTVSKNKYLVAVPESYRKKMRGLKTVEMKPVYPVIPDSLKPDQGDNLMLERDVVDSTAVPEQDSVYAITKTKEQYNVDQDIYMWYFRDQLVLPDVRAAMDTQSKNKAEAANARKKKKGLFSFLKFGKKKKAADSLAVEEQPLIPTDSDTTAAPPKKKGLMGIFGGKNKKKDPAAPAKKKEDAKKEEDGF
jgi:hypothetical protein